MYNHSNPSKLRLIINLRNVLVSGVANAKIFGEWMRHSRPSVSLPLLRRAHHEQLNSLRRSTSQPLYPTSKYYQPDHSWTEIHSFSSFQDCCPCEAILCRERMRWGLRNGGIRQWWDGTRIPWLLAARKKTTFLFTDLPMGKFHLLWFRFRLVFSAAWMWTLFNGTLNERNIKIHYAQLGYPVSCSRIAAIIAEMPLFIIDTSLFNKPL